VQGGSGTARAQHPIHQDVNRHWIGDVVLKLVPKGCAGVLGAPTDSPCTTFLACMLNTPPPTVQTEPTSSLMLAMDA
jgi:hypothetical protein